MLTVFLRIRVLAAGVGELGVWGCDLEAQT